MVKYDEANNYVNGMGSSSVFGVFSRSTTFRVLQALLSLAHTLLDQGFQKVEDIEKFHEECIKSKPE